MRPLYRKQQSGSVRHHILAREHRVTLLESIARGRAWLGEIIVGTATIEAIAVRQKCIVRHVNVTISMAFIAPGPVKAAVVGIANLR